MKALVIGIGTATFLSGCTLGIQPQGNSPSISYTVPRSYQIVYLRAQNQASECLRGKKQYDVYAQVDPVLQTALVAVRGPMESIEVARTEIKAVDARHTEVTHAVWGRSPWDNKALNAMRESIRMDTSVCMVYK
ncbi:hypothetical protein EKL30_18120 [Candidimonas sp. SYP-B2681]|uniref:BPTD_2524 family lipoprotein n=1 Tax=Candidimonas sp. SYP-B2681 TaxID=2497686 RepID=UPI000F891160|nr:hypothetical protein [Candidimonas sp. SYP-B2681]RTZ39225.1 hypothetical protein EKL30_18120 [Candidimonas sp. SYP-B2681]